jgi:hypothetical protein
MVAAGLLGTLTAGCETSLPGGVHTWVLAFLPTMVVGLGLGFALNLVGIRKGKREVERGYTTAANVAKQNKDLYLVHWRTLRTISAPGEDRPAGLIL